jgi:DNA-binding NarL/FixJ family response regulator
MNEQNAPLGSSLIRRVVMVEADPVYRQFMRQVLKKIEGVNLSGECGTASEGMALCLKVKPEALVLDLLLPDQQGIEVVKAMRGILPDALFFLTTAVPSNDLPRALMKLGVQGFVDKTGTANEVLRAVLSVWGGGIYYASSAGLDLAPSELVINLSEDMMKMRPDTLSRREREIAVLVAAAMSSKEVAAKLRLSTRTVEKHRANIYAKLGIRDVVGLTRWSLYHRIVS